MVAARGQKVAVEVRDFFFFLLNFYSKIVHTHTLFNKILYIRRAQKNGRTCTFNMMGIVALH